MADTRQMAGPPQPERTPAAATPDTPARPAEALRAQPRRAFDAAFVTALTANAETAVALFESESRDGRDGEIKEWAARQLPALREHLTALRTLRLRPGS
jgi:putative membrane protein